MNATKRKFNALLQGMGTKPVSSAPGDEKKDLSSGALRHGVSKGSATNGASISTSTPFPTVATATAATAATTTAATAAAATAATATTITTTTTKTATGSATAAAFGADLDFLAKRRRIAAASGQLTLRDTSGQASTTVSQSVLRKRPGEAETDANGGAKTSTHTQTQKPAPRYCPGDRDQLLRRLATFQELTDWAPKPDRISEIEWARRGWVCQGKERLRCTLCSKELVVGATDNDTDKKSVLGGLLATSTASDALVDKYAELVVAAHDDDCLWRKKGCDATLLRLPLAHPSTAVADLRTRYAELCARADQLPCEANLRLPEGLDLTVVEGLDGFGREASDGLGREASDGLGREASDRLGQKKDGSAHRVALALALTGWQGLTDPRIGAVTSSASCHTCLRRLGLWMFRSKKVDPVTGVVLEPAPMDALDAVREHRFFCPWKNGAVQRNPGGHASPSRKKIAAAGTGADADSPPGWAVLAQVLRNDAYLRNRLSSSLPVHASASATPNHMPPSTPTKATAASSLLSSPLRAAPSPAHTTHGEVGPEDTAARDAKDKERWARLRRVKSLFDPKGTAAKRLKERQQAGSTSSVHMTGVSRPGTAQSTAPPGGRAA